MLLKFTKMHGCGNDYVLLENLNNEIENAPELARAMCARRFGIGADGLLDYFYEVTPVDAIALLNIGSRPSHRKKKDRSLGSIRAIPWVFGWAQSRHTLPAWFGIALVGMLLAAPGMVPLDRFVFGLLGIALASGQP